MNSLSWLIYLAEISDTLNIFSGILCFITFLVSVISPIVYFVGKADSDRLDKNEKELLRIFGRISIIAIISFLCSSAVNILTPSSKTIYMIAASQTGEMIVNSPDAQEMLNGLKTIIRNKINEQIKED